MNNIVGQPVEGEDFFDRQDELRRLWESLQEGNHVLLLAPRRVGKTSLAIRTGAEAVRAGWKYVLVDVQKDHDELSFLSNLFDNLKSAGLKVPILARVTESVAWVRRTMKGKVEGWGMSVELNGDGGAETATLEGLVDRLFAELEASSERVLIVVDELPVFLTELQRHHDDPNRIRAFLNWFRGLRIRYRKNVRWLLLGSVGLDGFVEARNLTPSINDLDTATLGAYSDEAAMKFLQCLGESKNVELSEEVRRSILSEIGWPLPFFLQLVFQRLYSNLGRPARAPSIADVQEACRQLMRPDFYKHFEPWRGRLAEGLEPDEHKAAVAILNTLCTRPEGLPRTKLHDTVATKFPQRDSAEVARLVAVVLGQLERDGYLLRAEAPKASASRYTFRSFLLRQYWFAREIA